MTKETLEPKKEKAVEVPATMLKSLKKDMDALKKNNDLLLQIADKKQLANYYARHKQNLPSIVKLRMIGDKVIMGWRTIEDKGSFQHPLTGAWMEKQTIQLVYEDKTTEKMEYREFVHKYITTKAKVLSTVTDEATGKTAFKVEREDNGAIFTIAVEYLN